MVSSTGIPGTSTAARVRPNGGDGTSIGANGIRYAARDATIVRMSVEPPFTVTIAATAGVVVVVVVVIINRIPAVREDGER